MTAYYNEIEPIAVEALKELMDAGLIAPGEIDTRSIEDVKPFDLRGYTQCHFFAGIGVWSYALRQAGWPDNRPVWTGSCPCQPFSAAGKGKGFVDERHLWPAFFHLIRICRPFVSFGEQVASSHGLAWLDLIQADLEGEDYTFGAVDTCAAGFGAPHIRQRLHWVADTECGRKRGEYRNCACQKRTPQSGGEENSGAYEARDSGTDIGVAHANNARQHALLREEQGNSVENIRGSKIVRLGGQVAGGNESGSCGVDNPVCAGLEGLSGHGNGTRGWQEPPRPVAKTSKPCKLDNGTRPGPVNGHWRNADWLFCRDGKWRPTQSLSEPLADGLAHRLGYSLFKHLFSLNPLKNAEKEDMRVGRLRCYGNAIVAPQTIEFIKAYMAVTSNQ